MEPQAYNAMADERRQAVLQTVLTDGRISLDTFLSDDGESSLRVSLHHRHLPLLAESGYIDWDKTEGIVDRGPRFGAVQPLVETHVETATPSVGPPLE